MINKQTNGAQGETRWHYLGPDNEMYGPYSARDMLFWLQSGYFTETLQMRTENETQYHSLGEWNSLLGTHPFNMSVFSMEALVNSIQQIRPPQPPMMVMPPGIAPPYPPPQLRYPHFMPMPPMPLHHGGPNGGQTLQQLHSQPTVEPIDGTLSHTPDSENELRPNELNHKPKNNRQNHTNTWFAELGLTQRAATAFQGPQMMTKSTETELATTKDSSCQTEPIRINQKQASRLLSELLGQPVFIH